MANKIDLTIGKSFEEIIAALAGLSSWEGRKIKWEPLPMGDAFVLKLIHPDGSMSALKNAFVSPLRVQLSQVDQGTRVQGDFSVSTGQGLALGAMVLLAGPPALMVLAGMKQSGEHPDPIYAIAACILVGALVCGLCLSTYGTEMQAKDAKRIKELFQHLENG